MPLHPLFHMQTGPLRVNCTSDLISFIWNEAPPACRKVSALQESATNYGDIRSGVTPSKPGNLTSAMLTFLLEKHPQQLGA